jgi:hypothetical protein
MSWQGGDQRGLDVEGCFEVTREMVSPDELLRGIEESRTNSVS